MGILLLTSGKFDAYLAEIDKQAQERYERLTEQMKQAQGITEQLKAENALEWVRRLNIIRACAMEIVNEETWKFLLIMVKKMTGELKVKRQLLLTGILKMAAGFLLMSALLFLPAGSLHYYGAWRLMGLLFIPMLIIGIILYCKAPDLLRKRLNSKEQEPAQKRVILFSSMIFIIGFVFSGLDFRFGWTQLPFPVILVGAILFLLAYGLYIEVMRENAYLSRTVEIQENQKVIDTGLYSIVRHPMYMAVTLLFLSMPLVLGSAVAILSFLLLPVVLVKRIKNEEEVLETGLSGYKEYKANVKYRLIPFIW